MELSGKVIAVTGAARGQGAAEVAALLAGGAHVIACDRTWPDGGPELDGGPVSDGGRESGGRPELDGRPVPDGAPGPGGGRLLRRVLDVAEPAGWRALAAEVDARFGRVDGLVNNAGVTMRARLGDVELDEWNRVLAVNVTGPMLGIQAFAPLMRSGGSIVNVGSLAALTAHAAVAYTASKWALRGLSRTASMQLGGRGIRVNVIHPGFIETEMTGAAPDSFRRANLDNTPLARLGVPGDVAPLVAFLMSDASSYITGAEIPVDGGQSGHAGAKYIFDYERMAAR